MINTAPAASHFQMEAWKDFWGWEFRGGGLSGMGASMLRFRIMQKNFSLETVDRDR